MQRYLLGAAGLCVFLAAACRSAEAAPLPEPVDVAAQLDSLLSGVWVEAKIGPAPRTDDATFLRRAWLDLAGEIPPVDAVRAFLNDREPAKRPRLIDTLLSGDEFGDHWGRVLTNWAIERRDRLEDRYDGRVLQDYLRASLEANRPYSAIVRELLTGDGGKDRSGPANFLLRYEANPTNLAGAVGRQFLGLSLQCAQCHHHPFAKWTEEDFWGLAACFGRLHVLEGTANGQTLTAVYETRRGELERPDMEAELDENGERPTKKIVPRLPGEKGAVAGNRREALAQWLTSADNPYFARNTVNRVWNQLFGQHLAKSLDDLDGLSQSDHRTRIMQLLAKDFTASGCDLKRLLRVIASSQAYQLASGIGAAGDADAAGAAEAGAARQARLQYFAIFPVRPLSVDQLYQSIVRGTGYIGHDETPTDGDDAEPSAEPPLATVAQAAAGAEKARGKMTGPAMMEKAVTAETSKSGKAAGGVTGLKEADDGPDMPAEYTDWAVDLLGEQGLTIQRTLTLLNGNYVHEATQAGARLAVAMRGRWRTAQVEWLFLATLSRPPSEQEMRDMLQIQRAGKGQRGLEDVVWALLNSTEFNTNH
jgi:hypothetical protein